MILSNYSHNDCYELYNKVKCTVNGLNDGCIDLFTDCKRYLTKD